MRHRLHSHWALLRSVTNGRSKTQWQKTLRLRLKPNSDITLLMKELMGYDVKEIAAELGVSVPRVYQLIARAKAIGNAYRENC